MKRACREIALRPPRRGQFEAEGWRVRKDGTRFWASVVIDAIHDEDGDLIGFAKITRDLTEHREAAAGARRGTREFFQAQKMEAIGQFTGGVAHDFNNLLTVIVSRADLRGAVLPGQRVTRLSTIRHAARTGDVPDQAIARLSRRQT